MKKTWENYTREIFREDAEEVIKFFKTDIQEGKIFKTENQYLNEIERILRKYCAAMKEEPQDKGFWYNRRESLTYRPGISRVKHNLTNILYIMRLIQKEKESRNMEDCGFEEFKKVRKSEKKSEEDSKKDGFDLMEEYQTLDDEFDKADNNRNGWYY